MNVKLSPRLETIAQMIPAGAKVADIGTDHGRLPLYLVEKGLSPFVVASDRIKMPIAALKSQVQALGLEEQISVRLGDGLTVAQPGEVDTIVLSGMGGMTMIEIFSQSPQVAAAAQRLILQPQRSIPQVRQWLAAHGWRIIAEDIVLDEGRYYEVLCAEPGEMALSDRDALFGPVLLQQKPALFRGYLLTRREDAQRLLARLEQEQPPTPLAVEKIEQVKELILAINEVITCL